MNIVDILDRKGLIEFFNKYNINELRLFDLIFEYAKDYDTKSIRRIRDLVYEEKLKQAKDYKERELNLTDLIPKNKKLSKDELLEIHPLVANGSAYLASVSDLQDVYKEIFEEFRIEDYPIYDMSILLDAIDGEIYDRGIPFSNIIK